MDKFSVVFIPADVEDIRGFLVDVKNKLPAGLMTLTAEERQAYAKMGDKTIAFVQKAIDFAELYPHLVPAYVDIAELKKDMEAVVIMKSIFRQMEEMTTQLEDSIMVAGFDAFTASLSIYGAAKDAARRDVPGAKIVYDEMKARFPGRKHKEDPPSA